MKCGRLTSQDVDSFTELVACTLKKNPESSVALVISPYLCSEKVVNGHRGELRRYRFETADTYNYGNIVVVVKWC